MKVYKLSKVWAIFIYVTAPLSIVLFCWILIMTFVPTMKGEMSLHAYWFLLPVSLGMIALMTIAIIEAVKGKLMIDSDKIFAVSTFSSRQLKFNEIKGYRITDKYIIIESNSEHQKKIKVSTYLGGINEVVDWLSENYPDLDIVHAHQEKEEILYNDAYGWTSSQREEKLGKARKTAIILNWTGGLIGAWTFLIAYPYEYAIIVSVIFPILCLFVLLYFKGLIRIIASRVTAYPSIIGAIFAASVALCIRALQDYNILDYANVWSPVLLIALIYMGLLTIVNKEFTLKKASDFVAIISFSIFMFGYGYGAVVTLNCMYDESTPETYKASVLNKRISSTKTTTYYVELTPWGPQQAVEEVTVSSELYDRLHIDDKVNIYFMKGKFEIPWFEVEVSE